MREEEQIERPTLDDTNTTAASAAAEQSVSEVESMAETEEQAAHAEATHGAPSKARRERMRRPKKSAPLIFKRFVFIRWSARREPVDDMFWAEARVEGDWVVVDAFEQMRSRKDVLARLLEMPPALVAFDFPFSYPADFLETLKAEGIGDWRSMIHHVREDLKKNTDDGIRLWIERIGKYRESRLDDSAPGRFDARRDPRSRALPRPPAPPYERQSLAERFRRTDHAVRRAANRHLVSPVQIGYNRLTNRYEFTDAQQQGRAALIGMSMFDQLLESREDIAVWPMMQPKPVTIVEILPWVFTQGDRVKPEVLRAQIASLEDGGWEIPAEAVDLAARNTDAQNALRCLIGMIKTENRDERQRRPLRDYVPQFYADPQIQMEGWFYSVGYRAKQEEEKSEQVPVREPSAAQETSSAPATVEATAQSEPSEVSAHQRSEAVASEVV